MISFNKILASFHKDVDDLKHQNKVLLSTTVLDVETRELVRKNREEMEKKVFEIEKAYLIKENNLLRK